MTKIKIIFCLILLFSIIGLFNCNQSGNTKLAASLVILNGTIWTGNPEQESAEALAISGEKILALGSNETIKEYIQKNTEIIDANGKFICPGFTDSHLHFLDGGRSLTTIKLRSAQTPQEFRSRVQEFVKKIKPGTWVLGGNWDHKNWGGHLPTRDWIDDITPKNPVWISRLDGHMALANSLALEKAGITKSVKDTAGGTFVRNDDGKLTGILKDNAMYHVESIIPEPDDKMKLSYLDAAMNHVLSKGVTSVHHMGTWDDVRIFEMAKQEKRLKTRINAAVPIDTYKKLAQRKKTIGWGDKWIKIGGLKGFMDGSLGSHTALMMAPYSDKPSDSGLQIMSEEAMADLVRAGDRIGGQIIVHAIGDKANHLMLNIYEQVIKENEYRDRRFRIEHAQHLVPEDISRFNELGIIASMQPYHCIDDGRWAEPLIGQDRMKMTHAYHSLLDNNATLVFGSDWYVAPPAPLEGIYAATTRATLDGKNPNGWVPKEKITAEEALKAYTVAPAYASFEEDIKGTLAPGKLADIVILDQNILEIPPVRIKDVNINQTIVGGKVLYKATL